MQITESGVHGTKSLCSREAGGAGEGLAPSYPATPPPVLLSVLLMTGPLVVNQRSKVGSACILVPLSTLVNNFIF